MKLRLTISLFLSILPFMIASSQAAVTVLSVPSTDRGWLSPQNPHDPTVMNYAVGFNANSTFRNWFIYDIPAIPDGQMIVSATLTLWLAQFGYSSPQATETYVLHDVNSSSDALNIGFSQAAYDDLGTGVEFGRSVLDASMNEGFAHISLNSDAIAAITAAAGEEFKIGGVVESLAAAPGTTELLFGYTSTQFPPASYTSLDLTFAPVPETSTTSMLAGAMALACLRRRNRQA